jgi:hypothetical protein
MNYVSITGITLGIAVVVVLGIGLLSYISQLVKNAYQIKVEIRSDMESGLRKIEEEMGQKTKWMRSEVGEDVTKIRQAIEQDTVRRLEAIEERLATQAKEIDQDSRDERTELRNTVHQMRKRVNAMEQEISALKEELARRAALGQKRREDQPRETSEKEPSQEAPPTPATGRESLEALSSRAPTPTPHDQDAKTKAPPAAASQGGDARNTVTRTAGGVQRMELQDFAASKA